MPLQIRRGPTADRLAVTPLVGEIVYDTTTGAVYVGNGATAGGVPVTSFSVADAKNATATLFLGTSYTDNTQHSGITFQYIGGRIQATVAQDLSNYQGLITADQGFSGNLWADDSGLIVNSATHTVYGNFVAQGNVLPETTNTINIGSSLLRFNNAYVKRLYLDSIVSTGAAFDLPAGTTVGGNIIGFDEDGTYGITISGNVIAQDSTVMVNTRNGSFHGDLIGSVFADDSTILVDGRKGVLRGSLIGNADTATLATTATVATTATLTATNSSINTHYLAFVAAVSGNEGLRTDNGLSYVPSTNTLAAGTFQGNFTGTLTGTHVGNLTATDSTVLINATTKQIGYTGANLTGDFTGNVFTNLIDSADSSAITVTPATIFSSDVTFENGLQIGDNAVPTTSETFSLGTYTKKFDKLYLKEQANALWIGNAVIGGSGSIINLPLGSTVGGSAITTTAGTNAVTVTVNTTGTNADYYLGFVDQQSGNRQFFTDDTLKYNPSSGTMTLPVVAASLTGNVTGNLTGNLSATDATIMVNATSKEIGYTGATLKGTLTGNVTGDVTSTGLSTFIAATFSTTVYSSTTNHVTFQQAHNTNDARNIGFSRARGTLVSPVSLNSGDKIADLVFSGYNGIAYVESVRLSVDSDLPSNGKATFKILNNTGGAMVENFSVDGDGFVNINARLQVAGLSLRENNISSINSNDDIALDPNGSGTVDFMVPSQTTVGPSGAASALPAAPTKYIKIKLDGVEYVIPAYLAA
jgi:hypothetical protein